MFERHNNNHAQSHGSDGRYIIPTDEMLNLELFLRARENGRIRWKAKDGTLIDIRDLELSHIANILLNNDKRERTRIIAETLTVADVPKRHKDNGETNYGRGGFYKDERTDNTNTERDLPFPN